MGGRGRGVKYVSNTPLIHNMCMYYIICTACKSTILRFNINIIITLRKIIFNTPYCDILYDNIICISIHYGNINTYYTRVCVLYLIIIIMISMDYVIMNNIIIVINIIAYAGFFSYVLRE